MTQLFVDVSHARSFSWNGDGFHRVEELLDSIRKNLDTLTSRTRRSLEPINHLPSALGRSGRTVDSLMR
jgi:hypothetical protein